MSKVDHTGLRTWIEIDKSAIANNYRLFRNVIKPEVKLMSVVKSNAYGHSLHDFAKEIEKLGADWIGVDSVVEGLSLRKLGIQTPILVLGYTLPELQKEAVDNNISLSISNCEALESLLSQNFLKIPNIHIKVDTGMSRQGFLLSEQKKLIDLLLQNKNKINIEGLFTHFAAAKNPAFPKETNSQIAEFQNWREALLKAGFKFIAHACATSGTILFPQAHFDMVRIGIGMYGLWPSAETESYAKDKLPLKPILSWKTVVGEIKTLDQERGVGYDFTETVPAGTKVAILPIGYWHGYPRALSSIGHVLINKQKARVLGRVSMDMLIIDVTKIKDVKVGDEVTLIGDEISAEYLANLHGSSWYELVTRLNPLIKRIYF